MTYTDTISSEIHAAGWSYGHIVYSDEHGRVTCAADAHRDGERHLARAETLSGAYIKLLSMVSGSEDEGVG